MLGYRALSFYFGMWGLQRWLTSRKRQAREAKRDGRTSSEVGCVSFVRGCSRKLSVVIVPVISRSTIVSLAKYGRTGKWSTRRFAC